MKTIYITKTARIIMLLMLLCVGAGGFIGATGRVLLSLSITRLFPATLFPMGTFLVNILGCFFIGMFLSLPMTSNPNTKAFLTAGLMGGFTTFSTFSYDNLKLFCEGHFTQSLMNIVLSISFGMLFCYLGTIAGKFFQ